MITFAILAAVFIAGAIAGIVALLRLGITREESDGSLYGKPPTRSAAAVRRVLGWHGPVTPWVPQTNYAANRTSTAQRQRPAAVTPGL